MLLHDEHGPDTRTYDPKFNVIRVSLSLYMVMCILMCYVPYGQSGDVHRCIVKVSYGRTGGTHSQHMQ